MAASVLFLGCQLRHGSAGFRKQEDRIITETAGSCNRFADESIPSSVKRFVVPIRMIKNQHTAKGSRPVLRWDPIQQLHQSLVVLIVIRTLTGKAGRINSRLAVECIDFQS